jgi:putative transposase
MVEKYITHYNNVRLHSAVGYIAPADKLAGRDLEIFKERDRKLDEARELRKQKRQQAFLEVSSTVEADIPLAQTA